jgi:hypothetical protein
MNKPRLLLEAQRTNLYQKIPVPDTMHQDYKKGKIQIEILNAERMLASYWDREPAQSREVHNLKKMVIPCLIRS